MAPTDYSFTSTGILSQHTRTHKHTHTHIHTLTHAYTHTHNGVNRRGEKEKRKEIFNSAA